ncbi:alpha/beta hydrolase [Microbacterium sp. ET2]|uniref:alpha/beta fold hydrolase n=1 Tax=Microbacterium albipurpureum TaxID=3050384 RepID=UPI00259C8918|nr:alpha/beta hydrolase [Microbacterium sp. ET2 (Ac-2212)]WJL96617.1 alpha/beta hydrolase [Microbacterium sp. ET2 (Ac-2212)]
MRAPTVVLVHGAFTDSSSWNEVIARLDEDGVPVIAVANPLRGPTGDAAYLSDILDTLAGRAVLVAHDYAGMLITRAGGHHSVSALVYVAAFAPDHGESVADIMSRFPASPLARRLSRRAMSEGTELMIPREIYAEQFAADLPGPLASAMSVTQRPIVESALTEPLAGGPPAWRIRPSWFLYGDADRSIPEMALRFMAERADPVIRRVLFGGSHALPASEPDAVADVIIAAVAAVRE